VKAQINLLNLNQVGSTRNLLTVIIALIIIFGGIGSFHSSSNKVSADSPAVKSGVSSDCLDDYHSDEKPGAIVDNYGCNGSNAQDWEFEGVSIKSGGLCLSVEDNAVTAGSKVDLASCDINDPGQVWLNDNSGFYNPNARMCLSDPNSATGQSVVLASCDSLSQANEKWFSSEEELNCDSIANKGARVACEAESEWQTWQTATPSHESLLNTYTDGAAYEEWCADFVSYSYKQAGFPFTNGEANGWDESNANLVQYQGFTKHSADNYTPQPGDIAYFNYSGGHVEIVISGGKHPTFIYGNSAITDPTTGNGEMEANTIIKDGSLGNLVYYLSPN
jgi:hypothetical protein